MSQSRNLTRKMVVRHGQWRHSRYDPSSVALIGAARLPSDGVPAAQSRRSVVVDSSQ